jgi:hypothetical protein
MSTLAFSSAGSTFSISAGVPATKDAAGFAALTYTKIGDVTDLGQIGPSSSVLLVNPLDDNNTYKLKGSRNNGKIALKMNRAPGDPGQTLLIAAEQSTAPYSAKIVLQTGTILYFQVLVMSFTTTVGGQNSITAADADCEVSGVIITV